MPRSAAIIVPFPSKRMTEQSVYPGATLATVVVARMARQCVADVIGCTEFDLLNPKRGERHHTVGLAMAIHLCHIVAGRRHDDVARAFSRNRSTASHHFEVFENLRDEPQFDKFLDTLEERFGHLLRNRERDLATAWRGALEALGKAVTSGELDADIHFDAKFVVETFQKREPRRRVK